MRAINTLVPFMLLALGQATPLYAQLNGSVQQVTFLGPLTNAPVEFSIYLPAGYATDLSTSYPVIYHLHGLNGNHLGPQLNIVPAAFEAAEANGLFGKAIIVFPNGYANSMWADSHDMLKPAETNFIHELIPHVDANYRTLPGREHRFVQGFSMGGFGALLHAAKHPTLFCKAVSYDGALHTWSTLVANRPDIASEIFNNDSAFFTTNSSPWTHLEANATLWQTDTALSVVLGDLDTYNIPFHDSLVAWGVLHRYTDTGCPHLLPCLLNAEADVTASLFQQCAGMPTSLGPAQESTTAAVRYDPDQQRLFLTGAGPGPHELQVFNSRGILTMELPIRAEGISVGSLSMGVYVVRINGLHGAWRFLKW